VTTTVTTKAGVYNQMFTMHGTTMVFLVVMPMSAAFFNYLIPLQIGARDVAFPRLNAFSYWVFLFGGIFLYSSFLLGGRPNGGWVGYAPQLDRRRVEHGLLRGSACRCSGRLAGGGGQLHRHRSSTCGPRA
jgi:heme/copper-type cytochrome/quinol oxidase subunit 1